MANTTTRQQIRTKVLQIVNDTATSQVFQTDVLNDLINEVQVEVSAMWKWQFLQERQQILAPIVTHLADVLEEGDTFATVDQTTYYDNCQAVFIMQDLIKFTGVTSTTLTGLTGIDVEHENGQAVFPLLRLPANYQKMLKVSFGGTSGQSPRELLYVRNEDWTWGPGYDWGTNTVPSCTVINDATDCYLLFVGVNEGNTLTVLYQKRAADLLTDNAVSDFPDEYIPYIARMVAGQAKLFYDDDLDGMGTRFYQMAKDKLLKMAKEYGERDQGISRLVLTGYRAGPWNDPGINRGYLQFN